MSAPSPAVYGHRMTAAAQLDDLCREAIKEGKRMSYLEKMKLVAEKRAELSRTADERAQKLLDRFADVDIKLDKAFTKHDSRLDTEEAAALDLENAAEALSNMGNLPG